MQTIKPASGRLLAMALAILTLFSLVGVQLLRLQVRQGEEYAQASESSKKRYQRVSGMRGKIIDRNGLTLAYDEKGYDVLFYRDPSRTSDQDRIDYTKAIVETIAIIDRNGGKTLSDFALALEDGAYRLDFGTQNPETYAAREELWRKNMALITPRVPVADIDTTLRKRYGLNPDLPFESVKRVFAVWQESRNVAYLLQGARIARNVNLKTVAELSARTADLPGIEIVESAVRKYPRGDLAGHIVGYIGKIPDTRIKELQEKKYAPDDLIGLTGIESQMEEQLTGNITYRQGVREVEVNARNVITRELSFTPPTDGNNVRLTLDLHLQKVTEAALEYNITEIQKEQLAFMAKKELEDPATYADWMATVESRGYPIRMASSGACIVMDVKTGRVLAMADNPSVDPGLFSGGISNEAYKALLDDPRRPLFNRAISAKNTPGSIFKMATAVAGLQEKVIAPDEEINCEKYYTAYTVSGKAPSCWINKYDVGTKHMHQGTVQGLLNSCNYYFFTVSDRLGIEPLYRWASLLGLTSKTGIELPSEATPVVGNPLMLYDPELSVEAQRTSKPVIVANAIKRTIREAGASMGIEAYDEERLARAADQMLHLVSGEASEQGAGIRRILMEEMGLPTRTINNQNMVNTIYAYLSELRWSPNETLWDGVGQSITGITPIAIARYVSAIANGGTVYEAQIVDAVLSPDGTVVQQKQPVVFQDLTAFPGMTDTMRFVHEGMHGVISPEDGGTAAKYFAGYPYVDQIAAKTGTAQVSTIEVENNAAFVCYAPYDDPEIAIVVAIENGYSGGLASLAAKNIISYYMEHRTTPPSDDIAQPYTLVP